MTIVKGVELDDFKYKKNDLKLAIKNNVPIEDKLHVIAVISNPCLFVKRYILFKQFLQRIEYEEPDVILYVVEIAYKNQKFIITDSKNPRHLQLRTEIPLWHKENMINLGIKLLPVNWKAFAWIDGDLEFESSTWALDTLKILNGYKDIVQIFSHCVDMDKKEQTMRIFNSAGYHYAKGDTYCGTGPNYWHPGYAWAITRKAYEKIGGLYDRAILGSGDNIMLFSILNNAIKSIHTNSTDEYKQDILKFQEQMSTLRFGYVPGTIYHHFHGSKENRKYTERWQILVKHNYNPFIFIDYDSNRIIIPSQIFPKILADDIMRYFEERNEDE
jgi:hypothetical protein